ncbi:ABC transporter permease [Candidatus Epulonipiscium viviparus]|uniref:ABC transporter permease n=1 Tax=Candidatus Epulonipiscium viviparus TaxID=420336 RepID=UPI00016C0304|nr:ABC transporter permease subunit [Candidatus Epulopiscium viviparus]
METVIEQKKVSRKPKKAKKVKLTPEQKKKQLKKMAGMWQLYLLLVLPIIYFLVFQYFPMYGAQIAFKDYLTVEGIWGSPWVGLKHFERFINSGKMWELVRNTLSISLYALFMGLPFPVMLALMFRYIPFKRYGKFIQSVTYAPHFISVVVMAGIIVEALNPRGGMIDTIVGLFGGDWEINLMGIPEAFSSVYVWSGIWQNMGFSAIIYCAVLAGVDTTYHEAAMVDGATMFQRVWHIDIPFLIPQVVLSLILGMGNVLNVGFEKALLLQNTLNASKSEMISTYVYKMGIAASLPDVSYTTAIGLFKSAIAFVLVIVVNKIARKYGEMSIW